MPYGLITLHVYWVLWWSADTGSSSSVSNWLVELATVMPSLIHSIVVTSKSVEHMIDTVSLMVSGVTTELSWRPTRGRRHVNFIAVQSFCLQLCHCTNRRVWDERHNGPFWWFDQADINQQQSTHLYIITAKVEGQGTSALIEETNYIAKFTTT